MKFALKKFTNFRLNKIKCFFFSKDNFTSRRRVVELLNLGNIDLNTKIKEVEKKLLELKAKDFEIMFREKIFLTDLRNVLANAVNDYSLAEKFKIINIFKFHNHNNFVYVTNVFATLTKTELFDSQVFPDWVLTAKEILNFMLKEDFDLDIELIISVYYNLYNEPNKAIDYFKKDYEITMKLRGEDHIETAISLNNLSAIYENVDLNTTSYDFSERAVNILK